MLPMKQETFLELVVKAVMWGFTYYFIRRGWNPRIEDMERYRYDAVFGIIAFFIGGLLTWGINKYIIV